MTFDFFQALREETARYCEEHGLPVPQTDDEYRQAEIESKREARMLQEQFEEAYRRKYGHLPFSWQRKYD